MNQTDLHRLIARAIHGYDNSHALSGNDTPSGHHYGEAEAVVASLLGPIPEGLDAASWTAVRAIQLMNDAGQVRDEALRCAAAASAVVSPPTDRAAIIAEVLPDWEAMYEPGNVSDYLIGYANDEQAAKGAAEAWMRSQAEVTGRLEWVPDDRLATGRYDRWFELVERHDDGVDTGPGIVVRRRLAVEAHDTGTQQPTPCGPAPSQCDAEAGEPCANHEREQAHAEGEHCFCGPGCEAGAQQQPDTEARPPLHAWRVETRDPLANEWAPGSHFRSRPHAVERYETANATAPLWRDGTPVERRIVRETTTYTVEEPAPVAQQPAAETDEERADREATERDHARGDHTYCGITCEIEMPTEHLRNFVIAKGYPGTRGALDELLRRARTEVAEQQPAAEAWDVPDARPGTTDYTLQQQAAAADGEGTEARRG